MSLSLKRRIRALGPVAAVPFRDALRAAIGAFLVLLGIAILERSGLGGSFGFAMIAPFGASAVLLFAAVSSPLAQPWPVIMGNVTSALVAIAVCAVVAQPALALPLSVACAILGMAVLRATHPPGGAVALTVSLGATQGKLPEIEFVLTTVAAGSAILVLAAVIWAWLSGRKYPMRQFPMPGSVGTLDPPAVERLGLGEAELRDLLADYRQSLNLGIEDLARLIAGAELRALSHQTGPRTAGEIMSRDLVTVGPDTSLDRLAELFENHGFTSIPVLDREGAIMGEICQMHLITALRKPNERGFLFARRNPSYFAADIMSVDIETADEQTPIGQLVSSLSAERVNAVMVLHGAKLTGVVTQTDLLAALAREALRHPHVRNAS